MRASLWSALFCAASVAAVPGSRHEERSTVSPDATCGGTDGYTCLGSFYGDCCSSSGYCGTTNVYCGQGCQSAFGNCTSTVGGLVVSTDGTCGSGITCEGSTYGNCCSQYGYCGSTSDYCGTGCDSTFGTCETSTSSASTTTSSLAATTSNPICPFANGDTFVTVSGNQYEIECGVDRPGNNLKRVQVYSNRISDCIAQCEATTGCVDVSMVGTACFMKKSVGEAIRMIGVRGARLIQQSSSSVLVSPSTSGSSAFSILSSSISAATASSLVGSSTLSSVSVIGTSVPLTTAPASSASSIPVSSSASAEANSTSALNSTAASTTSYAFANGGGVSSGHALVTPTADCTTKPTATASCVPCAGQPGDDPDTFCGYTAYDDSYSVMPITCNTVEINLELTECTVSPDGIERSALCVNGQMPGPLIEANWGDTIVAHVTNSMSTNGSSIHWHGMRQNYTNEMDGVVSITQCALAPGQSMTYTFKASNYGFSWYHSHLTLQAYEGLFGPMYVHGPTTGNYTADAGHLIIQDWSHIPVQDMYIDAEISGVRTMDSGLINGMNIWGTDGTANQTGERYTVPTEFVQGESYLFEIVNTAIQSTYKFYIDGHKMTVIQADYVPIVPYETEVLSINIGQRYMVVVTADQPTGDYWLRFDNQNACSTTTNADNIKGIIHYSGSAGNTPNSQAYNYTRKYESGQMIGYCEDEPLANLVPAFAINVGAETKEIQETVVVSNSNPTNLYRWYLDGTTFQANWADATLYDIYNNDTVPDYSGDLAIEVPNLGEWVYIIIESAVPLGHPIHLHGHDFHILASGNGTYDSSVALNLANPPRRDVAFLPGDGVTGTGGFLVLAFYTDNPGVWLMHCHIGWHVAMGFALQIIEAKELIKDTVTDSCMLNDVCSTWREWADEHDIITDDSGV